MALIESWLRNRLLNDDAVRALVSNVAVPNRVYPIWAPQPDAKDNVYPFITFIRTGTEREYVSGLAGAGSSGLPKATIHLHCWDKDYFELKQLEAAVRLAVDGVRDRSQGVDCVFIVDEYDLPEALIAADEFPIFGVEFDLEITHIEPVRTYQ